MTFYLFPPTVYETKLPGYMYLGNVPGGTMHLGTGLLGHLIMRAKFGPGRPVRSHKDLNFFWPFSGTFDHPPFPQNFGIFEFFSILEGDKVFLLPSYEIGNARPNI